MRLSVRFTVFWVALALARAASAQHEHGSGHEGHGSSAWAELKETRDSIAKLLESGKLAEVHDEAARLAPLGEALEAGAKSVPDDERVRIEATLRQLSALGKTLDRAGDAGDVSATRRELKRLDGVIALIQAQYPADVLPTVPASGATPADGHSHAHADRPLASVDEAPRATIRVNASEFKFAPTAIAMRRGEPTRIELENDGAVEHALIVSGPDGKGDWIHLHASAHSTDAGTFRIDQPGKYPVLCTVPGHTEAGMVGELVVK